MNNPHNNSLFKDIKQQMMTIFMLQKSKTKDSSLFAITYSFIALTLIEKTTDLFPFLLSSCQKLFFSKMKSAIETIPKVNSGLKKKLSSITVKIELSKPDVLSMALLDFITNSKNTKSVFFSNNTFTLNEKEPVLIDDENEIYSHLIKTEISEDETEKAPVGKQVVEIYSQKLTTDMLRKYLNELTYSYSIKIQNKLGDKVFFFNSLHVPAFNAPDGTKDFSKCPPFFSFTMKQFKTNRKFINVMGEQSELIHKRVDFFTKNEKWYNDKGVPYTLGLLLSGPPGSGKTSTIKCLANETGRHIINVHFSEDVTKSQMENLFFNETIQVQSAFGKMEQFVIPINKRIYVFEDVDCQSDIVYERKKEEEETTKNNEKKATKATNAIDKKPEYQPFSTPMFNVKTHTDRGGDFSPDNAISAEKLTLSTLLNLLDGILETPGRIIIMTSNHPEKLDRALIRPGRIDLMCAFTMCSYAMMCDFFEHFYDIQLTDAEKERLRALPEFKWSPAELTKTLFENYENFKDALAILEKQNNSDSGLSQLKLKDDDYIHMSLEID
jgi:hypothetical protein